MHPLDEQDWVDPTEPQLLTPDALSRVEDCGSSSGGALPPSTATSVTLTEGDAKQLAEALGLPCDGCRLWRCTTLERGSVTLTASEMRNCLVDPKEVHADADDGSPPRMILDPTQFLTPSPRRTAKGQSVVMACHVHGRRVVALDNTSRNLVGRCMAPILGEASSRPAPRPPLRVGVAADRGVDPNSHEALLELVEAYAKEHRLRKVAKTRQVYAPVPGCPCAYVKLMDFDQFVPHVLRGLRIYRCSVQRSKDIKTYLAEYDEDAFPRLERDRALLSFANGVLVLPENRFVPIHDGVAPPELEGRVARHHIDKEYTGSHETPVMDGLLDTQFGTIDGRRDTLYMLIGRLFFQVKELDNWQVVPVLLGLGGTGKSSLLNVIEGMFAADKVGDIDSNFERVFGMQDKYDKELVLVRDAPVQMRTVLPQEMFQKMVAGEGLQVSVKNGTAFSDRWRVPIFIATNHYLDYEDGMGQISRRVVTFRFDRTLDSNTADTRMDALMAEELPNIVAKCLRFYLDTVARVGGCVFWKFCPEVLRNAQEDAMTETSIVYSFLLSGSRDAAGGVLAFMRREGSTVTYADFKAEYETFLSVHHKDCVRGPAYRLSTHTAAPFARLGYDLRQVNTCKSCLAPALVGCCSEYSMSNRGKTWLILNMEMVRSTTLGGGRDDPEGPGS
jgi:hypothetical protein